MGYTYALTYRFENSAQVLSWLKPAHGAPKVFPREGPVWPYSQILDRAFNNLAADKHLILVRMLSDDENKSFITFPTGGMFNRRWLSSTSRCQFHKHFTHVTYSGSKINKYILNTLLIATAISYACKMFMKSVTGIKVMKLSSCH
jgi:hypothetical protein